jgi:hypothetical protein
LIIYAPTGLQQNFRLRTDWKISLPVQGGISGRSGQRKQSTGGPKPVEETKTKREMIMVIHTFGGLRQVSSLASHHRGRPALSTLWALRLPPPEELKALEEIFRFKALTTLRAEGSITDGLIEKLMA